MKSPFFASSIAVFVFIIWLTFTLRSIKKKNERAETDFWERESASNSVRRKNLDDLPYIRFPFDRLPSEESFTACGEAVPESLHALKALEGQKIVNLNGISNTDLKLQYGTANITVLSEYDANYEQLSKHIYLLAQKLDQLGRTDEALFLLEEMLPTGTDITGIYRLLADIYQRRNEPQKIAALKKQAEKLHSLTKRVILQNLDVYL